MYSNMSEKTARVLQTGAVKLETFKYVKGENKGKTGVKLNFAGAGWQGVSPFIVRQILANSQVFSEIVALDDRELIAMAQAGQLDTAETKQRNVVGELGAVTTTYIAPKTEQAAQPAQNNEQAAINAALLDAIKGINARLDSFNNA